jgi:hypothetical protein
MKPISINYYKRLEFIIAMVHPLTDNQRRTQLSPPRILMDLSLRVHFDIRCRLPDET